MRAGDGMNRVALHPLPRVRDVLREQVRSTGLALRVPIVAVSVLLGLATVLVAVFDLRQGDVINFHPEQWMLPGVAGLLLPIGVWKAEQRFGPGFLWTLPVDRRRHALARVFGGWVWLMGAVAVFVLWLLLLTLVSGGDVLAVETIRLLPSSELPPPGALDPGALRTVRLPPRPLLWLTPFTAATATYLVASALALGTRHLPRWIAAVVLGVMFIAVLGDVTDAEWLIFAPSRLLRGILYGPWGIDVLFTAGSEHLKTQATLSGGERASVWRGLPDPVQWVKTTVLWMSVGAGALWAAASRHREHRRP